MSRNAIPETSLHACTPVPRICQQKPQQQLGKWSMSTSKIDQRYLIFYFDIFHLAIVGTCRDFNLRLRDPYFVVLSFSDSRNQFVLSNCAIRSCTDTYCEQNYIQAHQCGIFCAIFLQCTAHLSHLVKKMGIYGTRSKSSLFIKHLQQRKVNFVIFEILKNQFSNSREHGLHTEHLQKNKVGSDISAIESLVSNQVRAFRHKSRQLSEHLLLKLGSRNHTMCIMVTARDLIE